ncbi:MAG: class I SAM-dependent methyltransferase [bacterium]
MKIATATYLRKIVAKNYQDIATRFDVTRHGMRWPELDNITAKVLPCESVLDVGCGNARLVNSLRHGYLSYVGVEQSGNLAKLARANINTANSKIIVGDILELDKFVKEEFDWVFCVAVLHHIPGRNLQVKALKQLADRLNVNGQIVISVWCMWQWPKLRREIIKQALKKLVGLNRMDFGDIVFDWNDGVASPRYYHFFTERGLHKIIRLAELQVVSWRKTEKNYYIILKKYA